MGARIEDQLIERLHSLALDETLQVVAGATIGAHTLDAASALDATIAAGSAIEDRERSAAAPRSAALVLGGAAWLVQNKQLLRAKAKP